MARSTYITTNDSSTKTKLNFKAKKRELQEGLKDGIPIGIGYFAVAFSLGITAKKAGFTAIEGFIMSILCNASAGEYAFITQIAVGASLLKIAIMTIVTNARYLLLSCALNQKLTSETPMSHRFLLGIDVTDELFGIEIAKPGYLNPWYAYGAMLGSAPFWATGTAIGIIAGNILPIQLVSALSVALYGMFLAVIIPPTKTDHVIGGCVVVSFIMSYLTDFIPILSNMSAGNKIILLTVVISGIVAVLFPKKDGK